MSKDVMYLPKLHDDCEKLSKRLLKICQEIMKYNEMCTKEYMASLSDRERDFLVEKVHKLHVDCLPFIQLRNDSSGFLDGVVKYFQIVSEQDKDSIDSLNQ